MHDNHTHAQWRTTQTSLLLIDSSIFTSMGGESGENENNQKQALLSSQNSNKAGGTYESMDDVDDTTKGQVSTDNNNGHQDGERQLPLWHITCILSTSFSYGCIMTTLFIITLPVECERIEKQHPNIPKSVALGIFVAIAGVTQLVSPLVGMLSDTYRPPSYHQLGQRMPYLVLGVILSVMGLLGQYVNSFNKLWLRYGVFFFVTMIGLNITYAMMITLIPDQVPRSQTGVANGMLALLLVTGSLFGFAMFHFFSLATSIQDMYGKRQATTKACANANAKPTTFSFCLHPRWHLDFKVCMFA
jgi:hypothetical protein